jgi:hypothetical protein
MSRNANGSAADATQEIELAIAHKNAVVRIFRMVASLNALYFREVCQMRRDSAIGGR